MNDYILKTYEYFKQSEEEITKEGIELENNSWYDILTSRFLEYFNKEQGIIELVNCMFYYVLISYYADSFNKDKSEKYYVYGPSDSSLSLISPDAGELFEKILRDDGFEIDKKELEITKWCITRECLEKTINKYQLVKTMKKT